jgi:hypothetical protein
VQFERYATNEVPKVIRAPDYLRALCRRGATYCNGPTMGMLMRGVSLAFFRCQNDGSVSIYDWSVDIKALETVKD